MVFMIVKKKKTRALLETRHLLTTLVEMTDFRGIKEKKLGSKRQAYTSWLNCLRGDIDLQA